MRKQVHGCLLATGVDFDRRRFIPHITLGRLRHSKNTYAGSIPLGASMEIEFEGVVLFESQLAHDGARYQTLFSYPLINPAELFDKLDES